MKFIKFSLFIISFLLINSVYAQSSQSFRELNVGIDVGFGVFPSFLWGKTYENNKRIFEWQAGIAFPTIVTGKLTLAHGRFDNYSGISLRIFPLTIGPQFKINRLTLSAELGTGKGRGYYASSIFTAGLRF
tara:strand:+ start:69 stop:461 length:393 start_codon:yes stop_codon:yes gene_type:complete